MSVFKIKAFFFLHYSLRQQTNNIYRKKLVEKIYEGFYFIYKTYGQHQVLLRGKLFEDIILINPDKSL